MAALTGLVSLMAVSAVAATTTADAWKSDGTVGQVTLTLDGGSATAGFRLSSPPLPAQVTLWADATGDNASFSGDYKRAGVNALDLDLASTSAGAPIIWATLKSEASQRQWVKPGLVIGHNSISFDRTGGGWLLLSGDDESDVAWQADLRAVSGLGIKVIRDQRIIAAHNVTVSAFQLAGNQTVGAAQPTLADALQARFGVSSLADVDPALGNADDDGDGMSNVNELLAEFDPAYFADNLFKAQLSSDGKDVTIRFACVKGNTYSVQKASTVDGAYGEIGSVTAGDTGSASVTDSGAGDGPNFYRVIELP
ncbi:MAG: hypothetical protein K8T26_02755 [Lentisphaerae bacterium]|nr:hypothetical protein [Lentisphaerota bacterium]